MFRKIFIMTAIFSLFLSIISGTGNFVVNAEVVSGSNYYVALNGNDTNPGTLELPFATLEKARNSIRDLKSAQGLPVGGITVYIRGGNYVLNQTFQLTEQDSGTVSAPIRYKTYLNEQVRLLGGKALDALAFYEVVDSSIINRLPEEARGKVQQIDLRAQGVTDFGVLTPYGFGEPSSITTPELFINDAVMTISRWPNQGFVNTGAVIDPGSIPRNTSPDKIGTPEYIPPDQYVARGAIFEYSGDRQSRWTQAIDAWMFGYWQYGYAGSSLQIESIDTTLKRIKTVQPHVYGVGAVKPYYAFNLLEEIDSPGEWYLDRTSGILYLYPPEPLATAKVELSLMKDTMITMTNVSNMTLEGLGLELTRGEVLNMSGGSNNVLANLTIKNTGSNAISISGTNNGIISSNISNTGIGGIQLLGGDRQTLTPAGNYARNNHIYNYARINSSYVAAVGMNGVGNIAANNIIHNSKHLAIQFTGNDHLIEGNEIFDVLRESEDMGAIYSGRDFTRRGNVIRNNYFHDLKSSLAGSLGISAIYLDDGLSGTTIVSNVFAKLPTGVLINGGRDNIVNNNIMVNVSSGVNISDINSWGGRNLPLSGGLLSTLSAVPYNQSPYTKYPHLANILDDEPRVPKYNEITGNAFYNTNDINLGWLRVVTRDELYLINKIENNVNYTQDPGFEDAASGNYQLRSDSAVYQQISGFPVIPFGQIGVNIDGYRTTLPSLGKFQLLPVVQGANPSTAKFLWNSSIGADDYNFVLAEDEAFQKIVKNLTVKELTASVSGLTLGKTYYWKVKAQSLSRVLTDIWNEAGATAYFVNLQSGNGQVGPTIIQIGNLFDDSEDKTVTEAVYTDTFSAKAAEGDLGVETVIVARGSGAKVNQYDAPFTSDLQITPVLKFNYTSIGGGTIAPREIFNDAWGNPAPIRTLHTVTGYNPNAGKIEEGVGMTRNSLLTLNLDEIRAAGNYGNAAFTFLAKATVNDSGWGSELAVYRTSAIVSDQEGRIISAYINGTQATVTETTVSSNVYKYSGTIPGALRAGTQWGAIEANFTVTLPITAKYLTLAVTGPDNSSAHSVWNNARLELVLYKSYLISSIATAQGVYDQAVEGNAGGQYPAGSKALLLASIQAAQLIADQPNVTNGQLDQAQEALLQALTSFKTQAKILFGPSVIPIGNLFDDAMNKTVTEAVYTDTYNANADEGDLGVERVVISRFSSQVTVPAYIPPFTSDLQITPVLKFNYTSAGGGTLSPRGILNDVWGNPAPIRTLHTVTGYNPNAGKIDEGVGMTRNSLLTLDLDEIRAAGNYGNAAFTFLSNATVNDSGWGSQLAVYRTSAIVSDQEGRIISAYINGTQTNVTETTVSSNVYKYSGTIPGALRAGTQWGATDANFNVTLPITAKYLTLAVTGPDNSSAHSVWSNARLVLVLDKSQLISAIAIAQSVYNLAVEGSARGQYNLGSKVILLTSIQAAQLVVDQPDVNQSLEQVNDATAAITLALETFALQAAVDKTSPETTVDIQGIAKDGWYATNVVASLQATDAWSGVAKTEYSLDNGVIWQTYTSPITFDSDGKNELRYRSIDIAGNVEVAHTLFIDIDKTAPISTAIVSPVQPDGQNGWYVNPVSVSLSASDDNQSGVVETVYSLDRGMIWQLYTGTVIMDKDAMYTLSYRSTDKAGNVETAQSISFNLDTTAPVITISTPTGSSYSDSGDLSPQFVVTDNLSGVDSQKTTATLDGQNVLQGTTIPLYTLPLGSHTFTVTSSDVSGNMHNVTVTFQTYANLDSLKALVTRFASNSWIDNAGIVTSLQNKLDHGDLGAFIQEVKAQTNKHINVEAATYLLRDAQAILDSLIVKVNQFTSNLAIDRADVTKDLLKALNKGKLKEFAEEVKEENGKHISLDAAKSLLLDLQSLFKKHEDKDDHDDNDKSKTD